MRRFAQLLFILCALPAGAATNTVVFNLGDFTTQPVAFKQVKVAPAASSFPRVEGSQIVGRDPIFYFAHADGKFTNVMATGDYDVTFTNRFLPTTFRITLPDTNCACLLNAWELTSAGTNSPSNLNADSQAAALNKFALRTNAITKISTNFVALTNGLNSGITNLNFRNNLTAKLTNGVLTIDASVTGGSGTGDMLASVDGAAITNLIYAQSGRTNYNGEISKTNASVFGLVYDQLSDTNRLRSIRPGYGMSFTNESTNIVLSADYAVLATISYVMGMSNTLNTTRFDADSHFTNVVLGLEDDINTIYTDLNPLLADLQNATNALHYLKQPAAALLTNLVNNPVNDYTNRLVPGTAITLTTNAGGSVTIATTAALPTGLVTNYAPQEVGVTNANAIVRVGSNYINIENIGSSITNRIRQTTFGMTIETLGAGNVTNGLFSLNTNGAVAIGTRTTTNGVFITAAGALTTLGAITGTDVSAGAANGIFIGSRANLTASANGKLKISDPSNLPITLFQVGNLFASTNATITNILTVLVDANVSGQVNANSIYSTGDVSGLTITDRSDAPSNVVDAVRIVNSMASVDGKVDHSRLDPLAWGKTDGVPDQSRRDLGMMVSALSFAATNALKRLDAIEQAASARGITRTNFISGQRYTNLLNRAVMVSITAHLTNAVSGVSQMSLVVGNSTNTFASGTTNAPTGFRRGQLFDYVNAGEVYFFTNLSTGAGNSASVVPGSGILVSQ